MGDARDKEALREFKIELHRRITGPFLSIGFTLIACAFLLLGGQNRRGQTKCILGAIGIVMILQSLFLTSSNLARQHDGGLWLMYLVTLGPIVLGLYTLSAVSEPLRASLSSIKVRSKVVEISS